MADKFKRKLQKKSYVQKVLEKTAHFKKSIWFQILIFVLIIKLVFAGIGIVAFNTLPFNKTAFEGNFHYPLKEPRYISALKTWDGQHYMYLSQFGYKSGQESIRFFPLYPFLVRITNFIFGNYLFSAFVVSNILSVIIAFLLYKITFNLFKRESAALLSVVLLFAFPTSFYLSLIYSEAVFLFLSLAFFYYLGKNKLAGTILPALLLPLTRPTGIFILAPILSYLWSYGQAKRVLTIPTFNKPLGLFLRFDLLYIFVPFGGVLIYFGIMTYFLKNPYSGVSGLNSIPGWDVWNILSPWVIINAFFTHHLVIHGLWDSFIDRMFFILFLIFLPFVYKKVPKPMFFFTLALGMVPIFGNFMSYTRYLLPAFPIFIVMALYLDGIKHAGIKYSVIFSMLSLQILFFIMHILNYWVS